MKETSITYCKPNESNEDNNFTSQSITSQEDNDAQNVFKYG